MYQPDVFGLSEANLFRHHDQLKVQIPGYWLYTCPTLTNPNLEVSRVVVYIRDNLVVKPRPDLMNNEVSAIWLEIGLPHKHKILVCNMYREWGYLNQPNKESHNSRAQLRRWELVIENWEKGLRENKEVISTGDININSLKWMSDDLPRNDSIHKQHP